MTPEYCLHLIDCALVRLPTKMTSPQAKVMLLAIALQESELKARRQHGGGPARGFWQFEVNGVRGVMKHDASLAQARLALVELNYKDLVNDPSGVYLRLEDNDLLAATFARLLLWTLPQALADGEAEGWLQYMLAWRPGKPRKEAWPANFKLAKETVNG